MKVFEPDEPELSFSVPMPKLPVPVRLALVGLLLVAGYVRFDLGLAALARLLATISLAALIWYAAHAGRRLARHHEANPWDRPLDLSRVWQYQTRRQLYMRSVGLRTFVARALRTSGVMYALLLYCVAVLVLPSPNFVPVPLRFLSWLAVSVAFGGLLAAIPAYRAWRRVQMSVGEPSAPPA